MKKLLLITVSSLGLYANAQVVKKATMPVTTPADQQAIQLRTQTTKTMGSAAADASGPSWFNMSEAVKTFQGGSDNNYSYSTIFPDTNAYVSYSSSSGGASVSNTIINSQGLVFDPRGMVWGEIGPFQTSRWNNYTVDSIRFQFYYRRFNADANLKDTLYVTTFDKTSINRGFTSIYAGAVDYTPNKYTVKGTNANTQIVELTPADTIGGSQIITLPVLGTKTINGGNSGANWFGCVISYQPGYKGYKHGAPFDTIAFYNTGAVYDNTKVSNMFRLLTYFDASQYVEDQNVPAAINGYRIYNHGIQAQEEARYGITPKGGSGPVDYYYPAFYNAANGFPAIDFLVSTPTLSAAKIEGTGIGSAYPNPATAGSALNVPFKLSNAGNVVVTITNMNGQVVRSISKNCKAGVNEISFDTNGLSAGVYTYSLTATDFNGSGKVVIK